MVQMTRGDRPDARNIVILVSDGEANVDAEQTIPEAVSLKNSGLAVINVLAVGQSSFVNFNVLRSVASRPTSQNIFHSTSFSSLVSLTNQLINATCNGLLCHVYVTILKLTLSFIAQGRQ